MIARASRRPLSPSAQRPSINRSFRLGCGFRRNDGFWNCLTPACGRAPGLAARLAFCMATARSLTRRDAHPHPRGRFRVDRERHAGGERQRLDLPPARKPHEQVGRRPTARWGFAS